LTKDKAEGLQRVLAAALSKDLTEGRYEPLQAFTPLGSEFLDEKQLLILKQAIESGVRLLPNEN
jgi:hypothetical protein